MVNNNSVSVNNNTTFDSDEFGNSSVEAVASVGGNSNGAENGDEVHSSELNGAKHGDVNIDFAVSTPDSSGATGSEEDRLGLQASATTSSEGSLDWNVSSSLGELTPLGSSEMSGVNTETTNDGASVSGHATVVGEEALGDTDNAEVFRAPQATEFQVSLGMKHGPDGDLKFSEPQTVVDLSEVPVRQDMWWLSESERPDYAYKISYERDDVRTTVQLTKEDMLRVKETPDILSDLANADTKPLSLTDPCTAQVLATDSHGHTEVARDYMSPSMDHLITKVIAGHVQEDAPSRGEDVLYQISYNNPDTHVKTTVELSYEKVVQLVHDMKNDADSWNKLVAPHVPGDMEESQGDSSQGTELKAGDLTGEPSIGEGAHDADVGANETGSTTPEVAEFQVSLGTKYGPDGDLTFFAPATVANLSDLPVSQARFGWLSEAEQPDFFYRVDFELEGEKISILMGDEAMQELTQSPEKVSELIEEQWQALEAIRDDQPSNADADQVPDSSEQAPALSEEITHDDLFSEAAEDIDFAPGFEFDILSPSDLNPLDPDEGLPFIA